MGDGVYYELDDYAGPIRRMAVWVIDIPVLAAVSMLLWFGLVAATWDGSLGRFSHDPTGWHLLLTVLIAWLYLVVLRRSRWRTIAYRLLRLRIVTTKGKRPSLLAMTFRELLWFFGPFNLTLDLLWLGADTERQSLRDCYAGTYVVRNDAVPIGTAPIHLARYFGVGLLLFYPRVVRWPDLAVTANEH